MSLILLQHERVLSNPPAVVQHELNHIHFKKLHWFASRHKPLGSTSASSLLAFLQAMALNHHQQFQMMLKTLEPLHNFQY